MSISSQQARKMIRKAVKRVPEGEAITHLNIMPMMDMMTILLVTFIYQVSVGAEAITVGSVDLPQSLSLDKMPESEAVLIITPEAITVDGQALVSVRGGQIDPSEKQGGAAGRNITRLGEFLGSFRQSNLEAAKLAGTANSAKAPELMIVADDDTQYRLLMDVMYTATREAVGYQRFRFVVLKQEGTIAGPPKG